MDNMTRDALRSLFGSRVDFALGQLENDLDYQEVGRQQDESKKIVEELYRQFEEADLLTIRRHYEGELHKSTYEIRYAYIQGLRDCFLLFGFINGNEVRI